MRRLFALDQNFPQPIVASLARFMPEAELAPLATIDPALTRDVDDWEILRALHRDERPWDGLVTTDSGMLRQPRELAVLCQTKLTLVVAEAAGHDPLRATGLVLAHLAGICHRTRPDTAQVWAVRTSTRPHEDPWRYLHALAAAQGTTARALYESAKLLAGEL